MDNDNSERADRLSDSLCFVAFRIGEIADSLAAYDEDGTFLKQAQELLNDVGKYRGFAQQVRAHGKVAGL